MSFDAPSTLVSSDERHLPDVCNVYLQRAVADCLLILYYCNVRALDIGKTANELMTVALIVGGLAVGHHS
jgi:hypothetical protein